MELVFSPLMSISSMSSISGSGSGGNVIVMHFLLDCFSSFLVSLTGCLLGSAGAALIACLVTFLVSSMMVVELALTASTFSSGLHFLLADGES